MNITLISDSHGIHHYLKLVQGDMLIHAGDINEFGTVDEVIDFVRWFDKQPFWHKIFIAGNHDLYFEQLTVLRRKKNNST